MKTSLILSCFIFLSIVSSLSVSFVAAKDSDKNNDKPSATGTKTPITTTPVASVKSTNCTASGNNTNDSCKNVTKSKDEGFFADVTQKIKENKDMLLRTLYVVIGVTGVIILYFVYRTWRSRRRKNRTKKYGLITTRGTDLEMAPLDQDSDDDEDMTVFELNNGKLK